MTKYVVVLLKQRRSSLFCLTAGLSLFKASFMAVLRSPVSFFDTTPMGVFPKVDGQCTEC